jgi:DNA-binding CsgD family transcriptional regulator
VNTAVEARSRRDLQGILQIVDRVYAAACGEKPWTQTVAEICVVGNLDGCALSMIDRLERRRVMLASHGLTCEREPDPMLGPTPSNLLLTDSPLESALGGVWRDRRIISETLPATTLFWTDWMRPEGLISWACATVNREERRVDCLEVYAEAGRGSRCLELGDLLRQLAPHLSRAWRLGMSHRPALLQGAPPSSDAPPCCGHDAATVSPDLDGLPEAVRLRAEFGLTKAEARLALCLAKGWSLATAAEAFDVKLTTIRSQLQQVFSKTGTSRQAEFVAMLLSRGYGSRRPLGVPTEFAQAEVAVAG